MAIMQAYQDLATPGRQSIWPVFPQSDIPAILQDPRTGQVFVNPRKLTAKWFWLSSLSSSLGLPVTIPASGQADMTIMSPLEDQGSGDFEVVKLMSDSEGDFSARLTNTLTNRNLTNNTFIPKNCMFGTSQLPAVLFETLFLMATVPMAVRLQDLSAADNDTTIVCAGRRFMGCGPRESLVQPFMSRNTTPFWVTFDQQEATTGGVTVDANSTQEFTMTIPSAGDFECWLVMDDSATAYDVRILEGRSARSLMDAALAAKTFVASPTVTVAGFPGNTVRAVSFPFALTFTHLFKRNTQITFQLTNATGAPITVKLVLHGRLIYYNECPGDAVTYQPSLDPAIMPMPAPPGWTPCASPGTLPPAGPIPTVRQLVPLPQGPVDPQTGQPFQQGYAIPRQDPRQLTRGPWAAPPGASPVGQQTAPLYRGPLVAAPLGNGQVVNPLPIMPGYGNGPSIERF